MPIEENFSVLTAPDVAKILRISESSAYHLFRSGRIKVIRVGKRGIRTTKKFLYEFIEGGHPYE